MNTRDTRRALLACVLLLGVLLGLATAPAHAAPATGQVVVGTKHAPPYAFKGDDGEWTGESIELWKEIAGELELEYSIEEHDLPGLLEAVEQGEIDVAVAALTVTSAREAAFDFTHPFETTGLGVAVIEEPTSLWTVVKATFSSRQFQQLLLALGGLQLLVGLGMWLIERRRKGSDFDAKPGKGIGGGFWWAVVTMTTVGYGDKTPHTPFGRVLALAWMMISILLISTVTATIASTHTLSRIQAHVGQPSDLVRLRVGAVRKSTSDAWLRAESMNYTDYGSGREAMQALAAGELDAVVYDRPLLQVLLDEDPSLGEAGVELLELTWSRQDYAIAVPTGSPLRERINGVLPELLRRR